MSIFDKVLYNTKLFVKRNSSTILCFAAASGVVATTVVAVKSTPKAMRLIKEQEEEKGEKLTKLETIKAVGPTYCPSILLGISTIACIFSANAIDKKQQASLASLYSLLDSSYKNYKNNVKETFGEDAENKIAQTIANKHYGKVIDANDNYDGNVPPEGAPNTKMFMDFCTFGFFYSTMEDVKNAEKFVNDILRMRGDVYLNEYKTALGLESSKIDYEIGWSMQLLNEHGFDEIIFTTEKVKLDNGNDCYVLSVPVDPEILYQL